MEYFGRDGDRMHMMFNFQVNQYLFYALASADTRPLAKALAATKPRPAGRARSHFRVRGLSANHHLFQRVRCVTLSRIGRPAAIVIFWPAAFFVGGDKQTAAELGQMKGQMVAIEQASIQKCGIQFQGPRPPGT
jgi:hypothetical protein